MQWQQPAAKLLLARSRVFYYICPTTEEERKMSVMKIIRIILFVLLMSSSSWSSVGCAELTPVRATYSAIGGAFAPLWLAQDKGLFNKYGLAVDLKYILSATGTQALLANSVDIVNPATEI